MRKKNADIISVIDGIAFQTNILALNAAESLVAHANALARTVRLFQLTGQTQQVPLTQKDVSPHALRPLAHTTSGQCTGTDNADGSSV